MNDKLLNLMNSNRMTHAQIARELGVTQQRVSQRLKELHTKPHSLPVINTNAPIEHQAFQLYDRLNHSYSAIGRAMGVDHRKVKTLVQAYINAHPGIVLERKRKDRR